MSRPMVPKSIIQGAGEELPIDILIGARCKGVDPRIFYPERGEKVAYREAKKICDKCPVQLRCLNFAIDNDEPWGVWGGMVYQERLRVRRQRKLA